VQCDLALLAVDDERFWDDLPLQACTDDVPTLQHIVTAVGYPVGGENLCVTRGVVSRIDLLDYTFLEQESCRVSGERLLVLQIDAAINPGNSGGPVFNSDGCVVGVAFAGLDEADNIGYVIPMPVVHLFLRSYEQRNAFGQLPSLGLSFQSTENRGLRRHLNLDVDGRNGLLVVCVSPLHPAASQAGVQVGDVVTKLDGLEVAEDGTVQVIVGGLVFLELSMPLIAAGLFDHVPDSSSSGRILTHLQAKRKRAEERIVLLAAILESELTISYDACVGRQLTKFNGQAVTHLKALAAAVTNASAAPFLKFEFDEWVAVLETAASKKAEADVLRAHDISSWCSADVDPTGDSVLLGCITAFSLRPNKKGLPALS